MVKVYTGPKQYSVVRSGLEVYETDEDTFEPYISTGVVSSTTTSSEDTDSSTFSLHQGSVLSVFYYGNLQTTEHEYDYKDMSSSASLKMDSINKNRFYKGVRINLKKEWEDPDEKLEWDDLDSVLTGFITDQTFNETGVSIKVSGATSLLEQKFQFDFKQMKRSKILEEIIKTAGLTPVIDVEGLDDDVTDYTNISSSSSSSSATGGEGEAIDSLVKKIIGSETNDLSKAKKIHSWLVSNLHYSGYECSRYSSPEDCLKNKSHLNCADTSRLTRAMMASAGLTCYVVHGPYHFWTMIEISGKKYASDATSSSAAFNSVWWQGKGRGHGIPPYSKNGKNPSC